MRRSVEREEGGKGNKGKGQGGDIALVVAYTPLI